MRKNYLIYAEKPLNNTLIAELERSIAVRKKPAIGQNPGAVPSTAQPRNLSLKDPFYFCPLIIFVGLPSKNFPRYFCKKIPCAFLASPS